jgi:hypothetical protein
MLPRRLTVTLLACAVLLFSTSLAPAGESKISGVVTYKGKPISAAKKLWGKSENRDPLSAPFLDCSVAVLGVVAALPLAGGDGGGRPGVSGGLAMKTKQLLVLSIYGSVSGGLQAYGSKEEVLDGADLLYKKYSSRTQCASRAHLHFDPTGLYSRAGNWYSEKKDAKTYDWAAGKTIWERVKVIEDKVATSRDAKTTLAAFKNQGDLGIYIVGHCSEKDCGIARMPNEDLAKMLGVTFGLTRVRKICLVACKAAAATESKHVEGTVAKDLHKKLKAQGIQTMLAGYTAAVFTRGADAGRKVYAPPDRADRDARESFDDAARGKYKVVYGWGVSGEQATMLAKDFHDSVWT